MTASLIVAVLVLVALYSLWARPRSRALADQEAGADLRALRAKTEQLLANWCPVLAQGRDLSDEELQKYVNFVIIARAHVVAHRDGCAWSGKELEAACNWRDARVAESVGIRESIAAAADAWARLGEAAGDAGPAESRARALVEQYERLLRDAGEVNQLRSCRRGLNNSAERLLLNDLLPTFIVEDRAGLLTLAETRYMRALARATKGDTRDLTVAALVIQQQNGVPDLSPAQTARITAAIERGESRDEGPEEERGEDQAVSAYLESEDAYWSVRTKHCLESRTPDGPCLLSSAESKRFQGFMAARRAAGLAVAAGRPQSRFTATELEQARKTCEKDAAHAAALEADLTTAHLRWTAHIESTGEGNCEAGDNVIALSERVEDLAFQGGDFNRFMWALTWRFAMLDVLRRGSRTAESH